MYLNIENFVYIRNIELKIPDVYHIIYGSNQSSIGQESNGAGKTLFLETIFYCLYGESLRRLKLDTLIGPFSDHMSVVGEWFVANKKSTIRIERRRTKSSSSLLVYINDEIQGGKSGFQKQEQAQEFINSFIGLNKDQAKMCLYFGEYAEHILDVTPAARTKVLLNMISYDNETHTKLDDYLKLLVKKLKLNISYTEGEISTLDKKEELELDKINAQQIGHINSIGRTRQNLETQTAKLDELLSTYDDEKIKNFNLNKEKFVRSLEEISETLETLSDETRQLEQDKNSILSDYKAYIQEQINLVAAIELRCSNDLAKLQTQIIEESTGITVNNVELSSCKAKIKEIEKSILDLASSADTKNATCFVCKQELIGAAKQHIENHLLSLTTNLNLAKDKKIYYNKTINTLKEKIDRLEKEKPTTSLKYSTELNEVLVFIIYNLDSKYKIRFSCENISLKTVKLYLSSLAKQDIPATSTYSELIDTNNSTVKDLKLKRTDLKDKLEKVSVLINKYNKKLEEIETCKTKIKTIKEQLDSGIKDLEDIKVKCKEEIKEAKSRIEQERNDYNNSIVDNNNQIDFYTFARSYLSKFKFSIINQFLYKLQEYINHYMQEIQSDIYCIVQYSDNEIEILFGDSSKNGELFPYNIFSRGERTRIKRIFFQLFVELFNPFIILSDEAFDGVDLAGIESLSSFASSVNKNRLYLNASPVPLEVTEEYSVPHIIINKINTGIHEIASEISARVAG